MGQVVRLRGIFTTSDMDNARTQLRGGGGGWGGVGRWGWPTEQATLEDS